LIAGYVLVSPVPILAADPPEVWIRCPDGTGSSIDEYDLGDIFTVEVWVDSDVKGIWSWQVGIRFNPIILDCLDLAEGDFFEGKAVQGFTAGTINNTGGYVTYSGNSLKEPETTGVVGSGVLMTYDFEVTGYCTSTLDLTPAWTPNPESAPIDLVAGTKLEEKVDSTIQVITTTILTDGWFENWALGATPFGPTAVITQKTSPPYYVGTTIELYGGDSLPGFDGGSIRYITEYHWDFENDSTIDDTGETVFWNTVGYAPGSYSVNLTVRAPGGSVGCPAVIEYYNATMQYDDVLEILTLEPSPPPVGGTYIPVNVFELLAPYIGLTIILAVAVITVAYVKKRKRNTEIIS